MTDETDHAHLRRLIEENTKVVEENNKMLRRLYRWSIFNGVLRVLWFIIIIGLPFALYFYVLEPYFTAFGSDYQTFELGINEIPGIKGFHQLFGE